jgi:hypothetical protein
MCRTGRSYSDFLLRISVSAVGMILTENPLPYPKSPQGANLVEQRTPDGFHVPQLARK